VTTTTTRWDGDLLHVAITGRLTSDDIAALASALDARGSEGCFAVFFDRRELGAPTADGRAALEHWAAGALPRLAPRCAGWADLFDERRFRSLSRDGTVESRGSGYPQRTFGDEAEALEWVLARLAHSRSGALSADADQ